MEDNAGDADLIEEALTAGGHEVIVRAESLAGAAASLPSDKIQVVLLDLRLPDGVGVECVERIRACAGDVAIVALTGLEDEALALACIAAGAQDYLSKQELRPESLRRALGYACARSREASERRRADALQEHLATIVETSSDAIVSSTIDGVITSWNGGAERIFGYSRAEAIGRHTREVMRAVDPEGERAQSDRIIHARDGTLSDAPQELARLRKDGTEVVVSVMASNLRDERGHVIGLAAICRDVTDAKRRDDELRMRNTELEASEHRLRALAARLASIREEERTRIAREVHDELGQLLTGMKMDLRWISRRLKPEDLGPAATLIANKVGEAEALVDRTVETVQRIALELRPSALDALGLPAALRDEARRFEQRTGIATEVRIVSSPPRAPATATALFRIFQELMTNITRHAQATHVRVALDTTADVCTMRVEDDGVGIDIGDETRPTSLGVLGMRERAEALGGTLVLARSAVRGTVAVVRVPVRGGDAERSDSRRP